jgi:hypothetical protein
MLTMSTRPYSVRPSATDVSDSPELLVREIQVNLRNPQISKTLADARAPRWSEIPLEAGKIGSSVGPARTSFTGKAGNDQIYGGGGADHVRGSGGADRIHGGKPA